MTKLRMTWHSVPVWIATTLICAHVPAVTARGATEDVGELRIEGQGIEQLILQGPGDQKHTIDQPQGTLTLPTGTYAVRGVRLLGGHYSRSSLAPENVRVRVTQGTPATLKVGAPLRQAVKVERQGPVMVLNYELIGQGGESYAINRNQVSQRPAFTVYRGNTNVASGNFEFG